MTRSNTATPRTTPRASARRARSTEQKHRKRQQIMVAAKELLRDTRYESITMGAVAERADVAKGTLYLYFETKEVLFLGITHNLLQTWTDDIDTELTHTTLESLPDLLLASLKRQPQLPALLSILHTILEHNIPRSSALAFKLFLKNRVTCLGSSIDRHFGFLPGEGAHFLLRLHATLIGFQHMATPSSVVAGVLERPDMALFRVDLNRELKALLPALLKLCRNQPA